MSKARRLSKLLKDTPETRDSMQELVVYVETELNTALTEFRAEAAQNLAEAEATVSAVVKRVKQIEFGIRPIAEQP